MILRFAVVALLLFGTASAEAGRVPRPGKKLAQVQGFSSVSYSVDFAPGKPAEIKVTGDGDAPLAVVILDFAGRRVVVDGRNTDNFTLRWTATSSRPYKVVIYNRGGVPVRFHLKTN